MRSRPPSRSESDNRSPRVRSGARPSESHQRARGSQFRRAPQPLQTDSLAWAIKTAADCVTEVIAFGRSLTVVLAKLRLQQLPANAVRAQAIDLTYATLRRYRRGDVELSMLLDRPTAVP